MEDEIKDIKIIPYFLPPMQAGKYSVEVKQDVMQGDSSIEQTYKKLEFAVDAARFKLNSNDIYSVYPPANQSGSYSKTFPHIVFSRRTLPWERTIDGKPKEDDTAPVPWMALLLFTAKEMKNLQIVPRKIREIIQPNSDEIIYPEIYNHDSEHLLKLMPWEDLTDGCLTIDISKKQFEDYIPSLKSLSFLAHAKEVSLDNKDKEGISDIDEDGVGVFSVIMGNRLPKEEHEHTAILVSLEGYTEYLKNDLPENISDSVKAKKEIRSEQKARLIVLASWNFEDSGTVSLSELIEGFEIKSLKIQKENEAELLPYFEAGYVPMEHLTRNGGRAISWYRGPFTSKFYPTRSKSISYGSADAALRYDKATGFFDVSFAAAWQLGRMLALQNQEFSKTMLNWQLAENRLASDNAKNKEYDEILNDGREVDLKGKIINYLKDGENGTKRKETENFQAFTASIETEIKSFLGDLYELKGVPFSYLVPHELLLEKEHHNNGKEYSGTLSFFYVDPNWIEALLDGALSIGKLQDKDSLIDYIINDEKLIKNYNTEAEELEFEKEVNGETIKYKVTGNRLNTTGFLFRSNLIAGWRGIEIEVFGVDKKPIPVIRFERIDTDILLGIFDGNIASITITQPYEGLYFGTQNQKTKNFLLEEEFLNVEGILNVEGLAKKMAHKDPKTFTSAEFAIQMIEKPIQKTINVNIQTS